MRKMPSDTITVTLPDFGQSETVFGDPGFPVNGWGGDDTITATVNGTNANVTLYGEDIAMHGNSRGGDDHLVANVPGPWSSATVVGDAQDMFDNAKGGNDTLYGDAGNGWYSNVSLYGDAQHDMSGNAKGGDDSITAVTGARGYANEVSGDAGGTMTDNAHGGNDTIDVIEKGMQTSASVSGDAIGAMSGNAHGGDDNLTMTFVPITYLAGGGMAGDSMTALTDNAHGGDDTLTVRLEGPLGDQSATLFGDAPQMSGNAHGGNDILNGGPGSDFLYGDAQTYAPATPGSVTGGKDVLNGGGGNDWLWGGPNNDTFVFNTGSGADVIKDFDQGNKAVGSSAPEHDVINVKDYGFASWQALSSLISDDNSGNAVIHLTANDTITLAGVHAAELHPTDFIV